MKIFQKTFKKLLTLYRYRGIINMSGERNDKYIRKGDRNGEEKEK